MKNFVLGAIFAVVIFILGGVCFKFFIVDNSTQNDGTEIASDVTTSQSDEQESHISINDVLNENPAGSEGADNEAKDDDNNEDSNEAGQNAAGSEAVTFAVGEAWEEGGKMCATYNFSVLNNSGDKTKSWKVTCAVAEGTEISSAWNCDAEIKDGIMTAKSVDYNGEMTDGASTGFGIIIKSEGEFKPVGMNVEFEK